jgi:hypothetical protein
MSDEEFDAFLDHLQKSQGMTATRAQFYIMQSRDQFSAEQLKRASDWALSKSASERQAQQTAYERSDVERAAAYKGAMAEYVEFHEEHRQAVQADVSAIESAQRAAESQGERAQIRWREQLAAERRMSDLALAAQERKDWEMAHQTEVERATLTEEEKQLLAYEAHPLMYQVGVFNQALVTTAASYLSGAAEGIRKYAPMAMLGRYVEKTLGTSENAYVAETATLLGELAQIGPKFLAGVIDVPAAVEHTIREAGVVTRIAEQHGAITTLTHVTGTRQLMEAVFGYDVLTGEKVDRWAKAQEGLARFSSTLMTIAGAMKTAGVDATLIPRPKLEPASAGMFGATREAAEEAPLRQMNLPGMESEGPGTWKHPLEDFGERVPSLEEVHPETARKTFLGKAGPKPSVAPSRITPADVPTYSSGKFEEWFDKQTPAQLREYWRDQDLKDKITTQLLGPRGEHEFLMRVTAPKWKEWGVNARELREKYSIAIDELNRRAKGWRHTTGPGTPAEGSKRVHNELQKIINDSNSLQDFKQKLKPWAQAYLNNGVQDLPSALQ